jgi:hypothetical protein
MTPMLFYGDLETYVVASDAVMRVTYEASLRRDEREVRAEAASGLLAVIRAWWDHLRGRADDR